MGASLARKSKTMLKCVVFVERTLILWNKRHLWGCLFFPIRSPQPLDFLPATLKNKAENKLFLGKQHGRNGMVC